MNSGMSPANYGGGALIAGQIAIALGIVFPNLTTVQAGAVAGLIVAAFALIHGAIAAYFPPKGPPAPVTPLPPIT